MYPLKIEVLWDEAICSWLAGEYERQQAPLTTTDLQKLANEEAVRISDVFETLYLMAIEGVWHYCDDQGNPQDLDEDALDALYAKGRIGAEDLVDFKGVWLPAL